MAKQLLGDMVVPFLGAGVNMCGRTPNEPYARGKHLPNGTELACYLADEYFIPRDEANLARVSQHAEVLVGGGPLYKKLRTVFDHDFEPTEVHRFLASMPKYAREFAHDSRPTYQLILTTCYDDALERAFAEQGEPVDVLTYMERGSNIGCFVHTDPDGVEVAITSPNTYELRPDHRPLILKIHGAIDRSALQNDSFVITEDDYVDYVIRAGSDLGKVFPVEVLSKARNSGFLFLGYSLRDWNLRVILNRIEAARNATFEHWSVQLDANDLDRKAWRARGVEVITVALEEYVTELRAAVALEASRQFR